MTILSRAQLYQYARTAGFSGAALDEVVAISLAESGGNTLHVNINKSGSTAVVNGKTVQVPPGTGDYGPLQINTWWNPGVTVAQAQDPTFAFAWAYKVTGGRQPTATSDPFRPYWVTVQNSAYKKYLTPGGGGATTTGTTSPVASGVGTSGAGATVSMAPLIDLSPITNWIASLQGLWNWVGNPVRILKVVTGVLLIGVSLVLMISPEAEEVGEDLLGDAIEPKAQPKEAGEEE